MSRLGDVKELLTEAQAADEVSADVGLKLVAALEAVEKYTFPTRKAWQGHIGSDHDTNCYTKHPQCLAQLIAASVAVALS